MFLRCVLCVPVLAGAVASAHAAEAVPGSVEILPSSLSYNISAYGGLARGSIEGGETWTFNTFGAEARVGAVNGTTGIQGDLWGSTTNYSFGGNLSFLAAGLHINHRTADGVFGGLISVATAPEGYRDNYLNTALEAQKDFGRLTLGVQGGYMQTIADTGASSASMDTPTAWHVHGIARWFTDDNLMFAGEGGYSWVNGAAGQSADVLRWGARLEYKAQAAPVSAFVSYQGYNWDQGPTLDGTIHSLTVGLSFIGRGESLAQRYRGAAGLDDRNPIFGVVSTP